MIWIIVFFGVIVRYTPITGQTLWTTEIARLLLLWSAFWAAGSVERFGYHFRVDLLDNILSGKPGLFLQLFIKLILLVSLGTLIWWTIPHIQSVLGIRLFSLKFPQVIRDVPLLLGGLLLFIHALTDFIRIFRKVFE
jgi:TRAP-type C4-dicarboxylate transport system permease small subunit